MTSNISLRFYGSTSRTFNVELWIKDYPSVTLRVPPPLNRAGAFVDWSVMWNLKWLVSAGMVNDGK